MTQKVIKVGDSAAVIIPKKSLKSLGIKAGGNVIVEVNEQARVVSIRPADNVSGHQEKISKLTLNFIKRYRKDLEALANK